MLEDLDAPKSWGLRNVYEKFEGSLPFNRIHITKFLELVEQADSEVDNDGKVTLKDLRKVFNSPAWAALDDQESTLAKVLLSAAFKDEKKGTDALEIDADTLKMFGLLHCQGESNEKAVALYAIL